MRNLLFLLPLVFLLAACGAPQAPQAEVSDATGEATAVQGNYAIDTAASQLGWIGTKLSGRHNGVIPITRGELALNGTTVTGGTIHLAVNRLQVSDLTGGSRAKLEGHLRSPDFFAADSFPEAEFMILETTAMTADSAGNNHNVKGQLRLRGVNKKIRFPANIRMVGDSLAADANFNINRQDWGVKYTGKQDDLIRDDVNLKLRLRAFPVQRLTPQPAAPAQ